MTATHFVFGGYMRIFAARKINNSISDVMEVFKTAVYFQMHIYGTLKNIWLHEECAYEDGRHEGPENN
jgi:hypothetical protein